jgi:7-cyano-7-deazaguanine tRNA-ribosyltransferase
MTNHLSHFSTKVQARNGRIGKLTLRDDSSRFEIDTPALFPVVCFITGTTPRGGGLWKYILQADENNGLLRRNIPTMSQVLHFLDFSSSDSKALEKWRMAPIREHYNSDDSLNLNYTAPIFLDSGGFKLLWSDNLDLSDYGLSIQGDDGVQTILDLQQDFGGNIVATLDYPLPPGLASSEALERMKRSRDNAVQTALKLEKNGEQNPFLFVAAHGRDKTTIGQYVQLVFKEFKKNGLSDFPFGLAVGSLVPLRGAHKYQIITEILRSVVNNVPSQYQSSTPIHVFGVTGNLIPILAYLGVDSFDSSTYVQEARSLGYFDPRDGRSKSILEIEDDEWVCECPVCQQTSLTEIQNAITSSIRYKPLPNGHYKSKYYADIALHNLELDFATVHDTRCAIEADCLQEFLVEHVSRYPQLQPAIEVIAETDEVFRTRLSKTVIALKKVVNETQKKRESISLTYRPDDFNILENGYPGPPSSARILLIIPCSKGKPYSSSRSHRFLTERLGEVLGNQTQLIHKVILSGLYGPVPEECENEEPVKNYDFQLQYYNRSQINLVSKRVKDFLEKYENHYDLCLGYATSRAYREVLHQVARQNEHFTLLPTKPNSRRLSEFFRQKNVEELIKAVTATLHIG